MNIPAGHKFENDVCTKRCKRHLLFGCEKRQRKAHRRKYWWNDLDGPRESQWSRGFAFTTYNLIIKIILLEIHPVECFNFWCLFRSAFISHHKDPFFKKSGLSIYWLIGLFSLKIAAGIAYGLFYSQPQYAQGSDTWRFFEASRTETDWLLRTR
jgi:hypothetical protein